MSNGHPRVLIVADHASARFGGEAVLPLHYYRLLRARGVETWMVVHERTREELSRLFPGDADRIHYVPDTRAHRRLWKLGRLLPGGALAHFLFGVTRDDLHAAYRTAWAQGEKTPAIRASDG